MLGRLNSNLAVSIAQKELQRAGKARPRVESSTHDDSSHASPSEHAEVSISSRSRNHSWPAQRHSSSMRSSTTRGGSSGSIRGSGSGSVRGSAGSIRLSSPKGRIKKPAPRLSATAPKNLSREELNLIEGGDGSDLQSGVPGNIVCGGSLSGGDSSASALENKAEKLLEAMNEALDTLVDQEVELSAALKVQDDRARCRFDSGNTVGAVISIKKVKKSQAELQRLVLVIDYLESQKDDLSTQLSEFKALRTLEEATSQESFTAVTTDPLDLTGFRDFASEVQGRLAEPIEEENKTDEEILKEYKAKLQS